MIFVFLPQKMQVTKELLHFWIVTGDDKGLVEDWLRIG
jgi:hypothetical protein